MCDGRQIWCPSCEIKSVVCGKLPPELLLKSTLFRLFSQNSTDDCFLVAAVNMKPTEISHLIAHKQTKPLLLPSDFKALQITTMCSETQVHPLIYTQ